MRFTLQHILPYLSLNSHVRHALKRISLSYVFEQLSLLKHISLSYIFKLPSELKCIFLSYIFKLSHIRLLACLCSSSGFFNHLMITVCDWLVIHVIACVFTLITCRILRHFLIIYKNQ